MINNKNCSNCGDTSHDFNKCSLPILSIGFVVFNKDNELLLIRRKNTMAFIDIIRGRLPSFRYMRLYEKFKILVSEITISEREKLKKLNFEQLWFFLWGKGEHKRRREFSYAKKRYESNLETLLEVIKETQSSYENPEYSFPKGRKNSRESALDCAIRELEEETGYSKKDYEIIENIKFDEHYTGTNGVKYRHAYYTAKLITEDPPRVDIESSEEVGHVSFYSKETLYGLFRHYEKNKIQVVNEIYEYLEKEK
jgi:8-oxo-dGTP pyrophosphatase MutT (NUDIX family)